MEAYRLSRKKFAVPLNGKGAAIKGGRWNSAGTELIYAAVNRSLAMAEIAVHLTLATLPDDYVMATIYLPDQISVERIDEKQLEENWNAFPYPRFTQLIGDRFAADLRYCVLQVPSAVTKGDHNFLINPHHPEFSKVKIIKVEPFPFDMRIFK